jgi:hypothetical protein
MKKWFITGLLTTLFIAGCEKLVDDSTIIKFYGDAFEDIGYNIIPSNGDYVIAGQLTDIIRSNGNYIESSNKNLGIIKVTPDGQLKWKFSAGGKFYDKGSALVPLSDGSAVCTGLATDTTLTGDSQTDIFIVKVSSDGDLVWQKTISGLGNQYGADILATSDGGFFIVGYTDVYRAQVGNFSENIEGKKDIFIIKINSLGVLQWSVSYGFGGDDEGVKIKEDKNGNYIILGTTDTSDPGQEKSNMILIKINSLGGVVSSKILGGTDDEYAADIEVLTDGYFVAGTIGKDNENQQILAMKLPANIFGTPLFSLKYIKENEGTASSRVNAVTTPDGHKFILAGQTGPGTSADILVMELDENGIETGNIKISGGTGLQTANDVITDSDGNIITVGKSSNKNNSMISFLKFKF